jgi:hydrogenase-4 membrane subunit HyfE
MELLLIITIYILSVLLTRWVMIKRIKKRKPYYIHGMWYLPLINILLTIEVLYDNDNINLSQSRFYKWWTGDND